MEGGQLFTHNYSYLSYPYYLLERGGIASMQFSRSQFSQTLSALP